MSKAQQHSFLALAAALAVCSGPVLAQPVDFSIPAGDAAETLKSFGQQARIQILFVSGAVEKRATQAVSGELEPRAALEKLLEGTGLTFEFVNERTVAVKTAAPEGSVEAAAASGGEASNSLRLAQADAAAQSSAPAQSSDTSQQATPASQEQELEEILVTAQKRIERVQDVPISMAVINTQALTDTNQIRVQDYIARVPGVSFTPSGNGDEPTLIIRGIATGAEANPTVGYVVDGVPYGASVSAPPNVVTIPDIDPGDLERIEVLRGPQGTLYGAASIGGLVQFVTRDPSTEAVSGRLQVGTTTVAHSDDFGHSVRGAINLPLGDQAAVRISAFDLTEPGYIDNAETGEKDVNTYDSSGFRVATLWRPNENWSVKLGGYYQDSERGAPSTVDTALPGLQHAFLPGTGLYKRRAQGYTANIQGDLGAVEITSLTGYSEDHVHNNLDVTETAPFLTNPIFGAPVIFGPDAVRSINRTNRDTDKFSQELRLTASLGKSVELLAGLFYTQEDAVIDSNNFAAVSTGTVVGALYDNHFSPFEFEERAAFTNLTVNAIPRWQFQLGARASETSQALQATFIGPLVDEAIVGLNATSPFTTGRIDIDDEAFTYAASARYELTPDVMAYGRVSTGYRPGGPNSACNINAIPCGYDADSTQNYELGAKGRLFNALQFDAAVYFIQWDDIQIPNIFTPDFNFFYTANASEAESKGAELSLEARPVSQLRVFGAASYSDAVLTAGMPPGTFLPAQPGDRLPFSPRWSGNVGFDWEIPVGEKAEFSFGATGTFVDDRVQAFTFTGAGDTLPSYVLIDLRARLELSDWTLNAFVNNLADREAVLRSSFPQVDNFTFTQARTVGLSLARSF